MRGSGGAAAVEVHHPNRRLMVRRRSGPAITPAVVYDARLATPRLGSARANGWGSRCNRLSARVAFITVGSCAAPAVALAVSTSRLDAAAVVKGR